MAQTRKQSTKTKKPRQRKPIKRQTRHFQLRVGEAYPVDAHVAEILDFKRTKRSEVTAIRDGVRLLWALENGDLSVMLEMFPQYKAQLGAQTSSNGDGGGELAEIKGMLELIASQQKAANVVALPVGQGPKQIGGFKALAAPTFEEFDMGDEPTVIINPNRSTDSSANFVNALRGLGQ